MQAVAPACEKVPAAQATGGTELVGHSKPEGQTVHSVALLLEYVPGGQVYISFLEVVGQAEPAVHCEQPAVAPKSE